MKPRMYDLCYVEAYTYILRCNDGTFYTGSTKNLKRRLTQHRTGMGAKYTKKRLPVELVYLELFMRIDEAFYREKQIQSWSQLKKAALIENCKERLPALCKKVFE